MTEHFPDQPVEGARNPNDAHYFEEIIDGVVTTLITTDLTREKQKEAQGKDDRGDKVDFVCWELAKSEETLPKAVELRGLYIIKQLDAATRSTSHDETWNHHLQVEDSFWRKVDQTMVAFLHKTADKMYSDTEVHQKVIGHFDDIIYTEQNIAEMNGRVISRRTFRNIARDEPHHVVYTVLPEST